MLFAANVSDKPAHARLRLYPGEYGADCPAELSLTLEPESLRILEYGRREE